MGTAGAPARIVVLDSNDNIVAVGDLVNSAIRVNVVAGSAGGGSVTQGTVPWVVDGSGVVQPIAGTVAVSGSVAVTGTFFQATQPISAVALPLPTGAATEATLAALSAKVTAVNTGAVVISSGVITSITNPVAVTQSGAWSTGRTWALSSGTDSVAVSGSVAVTGSITANAGTNLNTSLLALEAGGNLAALVAKDFATQTTLAALNAKVTAVNTGAVVIASGSVTANAGTNLNTSLLALEAGGNLATIAGKDFATQTTLALIKAKTDNLDVASSTLATQASLATVVTNTAPLATAQGASSSSALGPIVQGVVSDVPDSFSINTVQPFSITSDGRLRVSAVISQVEQVWQGTFGSPWFSDNAWLEGDLYV